MHDGENFSKQDDGHPLPPPPTNPPPRGQRRPPPPLPPNSPTKPAPPTVPSSVKPNNQIPSQGIWLFKVLNTEGGMIIKK